MKRYIAIALTITMLGVNTRHAEAMLAPVDAPGIMSLRRAEDTTKIQTFLEQKQVSEKLTGYGFTADEVSSRLSSLTDSELHQVALRIDQQNPAGDDGSVLVSLLVIGILVLLFVYLLKRV